MSEDDFKTRLARDGFGEIAEGWYEPHHTQADHTHDFDLRVLITAGAITVTANGVASAYRSGDEFAVEAGQIHREAVGAQGVGYVLGIRRV
jgi:quercetin dioxygenase-like cupin family protein